MAACIATGGTGATTVAATMIAAHSCRDRGLRHRRHRWRASGGRNLVRHLGRPARTGTDTGDGCGRRCKRRSLILPKRLRCSGNAGRARHRAWSGRIPRLLVSQVAPMPHPLRMDSAEDIATAHATRRALGLPGGQLVANPIPEPTIRSRPRNWPPSSLRPRPTRTRTGSPAKASRPYLLQRIYEQTEGRSLTANIALVRNNATAGSRNRSDALAKDAQMT